MAVITASMRRVVLSFLLLAAASAAARAEGLRVLELYTSQGCASCPPAHEVVARLAEQPDVLVVSFHVRWWDYLGWPDPFALKISGDRQRGYAKQWRLRHIYTPQVVVQGRTHGVGADAQAVAGLLAAQPPVPRIALSRDGTALVADIPSLNLHRGAELWLLALDRRAVTKVERGENANHTMIGVNIVRAAMPVAQIMTTPVRLMLPTTTLNGHDMAVVLLQPPGPGPIAAAGELALK